jgi:hypothetical protein
MGGSDNSIGSYESDYDDYDDDDGGMPPDGFFADEVSVPWLEPIPCLSP